MSLKNIDTKRLIAFFAILMVGSILWYTYIFSTDLKHQEELKMEILTEAYEHLNIDRPAVSEDISLFLKIIENNNNIPMIITDAQGKISMDRNIAYSKENKKLILQKELSKMKEERAPIEIGSGTHKLIVHYRNSKLLEKLELYPIALIAILLLFLTIIYFVFKTSSESEKNKLWSGMAKETAHQIGTPLSSLMGWVEILRAEDVDEDYVSEIEKDVKRLNVIANRFSKIGSIPNLDQNNIIDIIEYTVDYFTRRSSKKVLIEFKTLLSSKTIPYNEELFGWVLENLIRNAIDAMQGKGEILLELFEKDNYIELLVSDTGKGIPKKLHKKVFEPGYTTKSRGWGLGLSLTKRIIEDYHKGKIFVKSSKKDKGTTFEIQLPL